MATTLILPVVLAAPFAINGNRNDIPQDNGTDSALASLSLGFPPKTAIPISQGGVPPNVGDFNALGYMYTSQQFFQQNGGVFTFDANVSAAIGGYPLNARLWGTDSAGKAFVVRSLKGNNTDNFVTTPGFIGYVGGPTTNVVNGVTYTVSWVYDIVTQAYVDSTFSNVNLSNIASKPIAPNGVVQSGPDVVVAHWMSSDGIRWYRKWASGWIEQGGQIPWASGRNIQSISFNIPFTNLDSIRFTSAKRAYRSENLGRYNYSSESGTFENVSLTGFQSRWSNWCPTDWTAVGY